jgi:hypothetical protein
VACDCDCQKFVESSGARVPLGNDNVAPAEVAQLTGLSVQHTLSYWRQTDLREQFRNRQSAGAHLEVDVEVADVDTCLTVFGTGEVA